ncbi:MAG: hypothetical protein K0Q57_365 [Gammaproteobacteria bacterium]|jgi:tetratricopeptide (TPR) repeat protein|nr:hypothetical protein [Gammaproteobacteria bacterium]
MQAKPKGKASCPSDIKEWVMAYAASASASRGLALEGLATYRPYKPTKSLRFTQEAMAEAIRRRLKIKGSSKSDKARLLSMQVDEIYAKEKLIELVCNAPLGNYINHIILEKLLSKFGQQDFKLVEIIFDIAIKAGMIKRNLINAYIKAAGHFKHFSAAKTQFEMALGTGHTDAALFARYAEAASDNGEYKEARRAFKLAAKSGMLEACTYASYIKASVVAGRFDKAEIAFKHACRKGIANTEVYAAYLAAAIRAKEFAKKEKVFIRARSLNFVNITTYQAMINAMGIIENYAEAKTIFIQAFEEEYAKHLTRAFFGVACRLGQYEDAKALLDALCAKGLIGDINYKTFIDDLVLSDELELADSLFCKKYPAFDAKAKLYDFHGYNFSETYLACRRIFSANRVVQLIVGRGSHSVGKSVVRQAVKLFCKRHHINLEVDAKNEGLFRAIAPADYKAIEMRFAYASLSEGYYELDSGDYEEPARGGAGGAYSVSTVLSSKISGASTLDEGYYFAY